MSDVLIKVGKKGSGTKRAFMQIGRIYTENRISSLYGIARGNGRKKETARKRTKEDGTGRDGSR
jgi:hypothetical protein